MFSRKYFGLLVASDELLLIELFEHVQYYLIENYKTWIQENFVFVFHTVFKIASFDILQKFCLKSICTNPRLFFTSKDFLSLDENIFYRLLESRLMKLMFGII
jgi:hypothetical protein